MLPLKIRYVVELVGELLPQVSADFGKTSALLKATAAAVDNAKLNDSNEISVTDWATLDGILESNLTVAHKNASGIDTTPVAEQTEETPVAPTFVDTGVPAEPGSVNAAPGGVTVPGVDAPYTTHAAAPFEAGEPQGVGHIDPVDVGRMDDVAIATPSENPPVSPLPDPVVDVPPAPALDTAADENTTDPALTAPKSKAKEA